MIRSAILLCALALFQQSTNAEPAWTKIQSDHFCLYVHGNRNRAATILNVLEAARRFFVASPWGDTLPNVPLRIVVFDGPTEYRDYTQRTLSIAAFGSRAGVDFIAMQDSRVPGTVAVHEYVHFVFSRLAPNRPRWVHEGLAEAFSSASIENGSVTFGAFRPEYLPTLTPITADTVKTLLSNGDFPRNDSTSVELCYEVAWAAIRLMLVDERYASRFPEFLGKLSSSDLDDGLRSVYSKSLDEFTADLLAFVRNGTRRPLGQPQNLSSANIEYDGAVTDAELLPVLGCVVKPGSPFEDEIRDKVQDLATLNPSDPRPEEALAVRAIEDRNKAEARTHLRAAVSKGSANPGIMVHLADLEEESGATEVDVLPLLQRAMELNPTDDTRLRTGRAAMAAGKYSLAAELLKGIRAFPAGSSFEVSYDIAYCSAKSHDLDQASVWVRQAQQQAQTTQERQKALSLLRTTQLQLRDSNKSPANKRKANGSPHNENTAMAF